MPPTIEAGTFVCSCKATFRFDWARHIHLAMSPAHPEITRKEKKRLVESAWEKQKKHNQALAAGAIVVEMVVCSCGKKFRGQSALEAHRGAAAVHRVYTCACGKKFETEGALDEHKRMSKKHREKMKQLSQQVPNPVEAPAVTQEVATPSMAPSHKNYRTIPCSCGLKFGFEWARQVHLVFSSNHNDLSDPERKKLLAVAREAELRHMHMLGAAAKKRLESMSIEELMEPAGKPAWQAISDVEYAMACKKRALRGFLEPVRQAMSRARRENESGELEKLEQVVQEVEEWREEDIKVANKLIDKIKAVKISKRARVTVKNPGTSSLIVGAAETTNILSELFSRRDATKKMLLVFVESGIAMMRQHLAQMRLPECPIAPLDFPRPSSKEEKATATTTTRRRRKNKLSRLEKAIILEDYGYLLVDSDGSGEESEGDEEEEEELYSDEGEWITVRRGGIEWTGCSNECGWCGMCE